MKKRGVINFQLSRIIAAMGHGDMLVIGDSGLPIPRGKEIVDLAVTLNTPRFQTVVKAVLEELMVEQAIVANETETVSPNIFKELTGLLGDVNIRKVSHEEFKSITRETDNIAFVRTGEATPYANVILVSGVVF